MRYSRSTATTRWIEWIRRMMSGEPSETPMEFPRFPKTKRRNQCDWINKSEKSWISPMHLFDEFDKSLANHVKSVFEAAQR